MALQNVFGDLALDASVTALGTRLDNILTELNQKLEAGQEVALNAATLAALEQITATINNWPSDFPDANTLAKLEQIRVLLAGTVAVSGTVSVSNHPSSFAVTNFPATQDVAMPHTVNSLGTITAAGQEVAINMGGLNHVAVQLDGSFTGLNVAFEVTLDGTSWVGINAVSTSSAAATTSANLANNQPSIWNVYTGPVSQFRVRAIGYGSGTLNVRMRGSVIGVAQITTTQPTGTQAVSVGSLPLPTGAATETTLAALNAKIPAAGQTTMSASQPVAIASDQSAINIIEPAITITGQAAQTAIVNNILSTTAGAAATDVANYRSMSVQVISTGTGGTFIFEQSNDNVNFRPLPVFNAELITGVPITAAITATASQIMYTFPVRGRFVRLRIVSTITGGSIQAFSRISTEPWTAAAQLVASNTAGNLLAQVSGTVTANIGTGSIAAGTNAIGDVGVQYRANATGAASRSHVISAATTNPTIVKASAGRLIGWNISNTNAAYRYVKFHNQTTSPTAGTGVVQTVGVPPNSNVNFHAEGGIAFTTGIAMTTVTGAADADTTAVGLNDLVIDVFFA